VFVLLDGPPGLLVIVISALLASMDLIVMFVIQDITGHHALLVSIVEWEAFAWMALMAMAPASVMLIILTLQMEIA